MRFAHLSLAAMLAAGALIAQAISTKDSQALANAILAMVACFLPAVQMLLPWFSPPPRESSTPPSTFRR